jgi:hypothetical protein
VSQSPIQKSRRWYSAAVHPHGEACAAAFVGEAWRSKAMPEAMHTLGSEKIEFIGFPYFASRGLAFWQQDFPVASAPRIKAEGWPFSAMVTWIKKPALGRICGGISRTAQRGESFGSPAHFPSRFFDSGPDSVRAALPNAT